MQRLIDSLKQVVPAGLEEIIEPARTLIDRATDTPGAYFDRPVPPTAPPERRADASSTCTASPWESATSPTTPPQGVGKVGSGAWLGDELDGSFWAS